MNERFGFVRRHVVTGVAGSGKTTIGIGLADRLGTAFVDADSAHPPENIDKMAAGVALTDDDRQPWLRALQHELSSSPSFVITCSALRRSYRDLLRGAGSVTFVFLDIDRTTALQRLNARQGHFMKAEMVESQFADLERPGPDEPDVFVVDGRRPAPALLDDLVVQLAP